MITYNHRIVATFPIPELGRDTPGYSLTLLDVHENGHQVERVGVLGVDELAEVRDAWSVATLKALADMTAERNQLMEEVRRLTDLLPPPPNSRHLSPREFLDRLSMQDKLAIMESTDPRCMIAMMTLFTSLTVDLDSPLLVELIDNLVAAGIDIDEVDRALIFA
jgi:hypothetical protein